MQKTPSPFLYLAIGILQTIHSLEEYLTRFYDRFSVVTGYLQDATGFSPVIRMSEQAFVFLNVALIAFLLSIGPFVFQGKLWASKVVKLVAVAEILNGLAHISSAIYVGGYFPGCISAIGLLFVGVLMLRIW